jgi:photosystem II stability/assembly factor-like uncharacterized protein
VEKVGRNLSRLVLALVVFAAIFLPSTSSGYCTSEGHRATDPTTAGQVYASLDCAVGWWEQGDNTEGLAVYALASHPGSPVVYAGLWSPMEGFYIAESGRNTWQNFSVIPNRITSLVIDPVSPATVAYAGTLEDGIRRSPNGGSSWPAQGLGDKEIWSLAVASTATSIYAYAGTAGEIYTSTNGIDWDLAGGTEVGAEKFYALAVNPQDSRIAYVGTKDKGVYRTTDGGADWTRRGLSPLTVRALAIHPSNGTIIYAGALSHGIFKSTDGGASWPVSGLDGHDVFAIAINPRNPDFIYAGTSGGHVWASYDGGGSWNVMRGLTGGGSYVYSLTLFTPESEDDCQVLYAGTTEGVWARSVPSDFIFYLPMVYEKYLAGH